MVQALPTQDFRATCELKVLCDMLSLASRQKIGEVIFPNFYSRKNLASSEGSSRVSSRSSISSPSQHSSGRSSSDTHRRSSNHRGGDNCRLKGGRTAASKAVSTNSKLTTSAKQRFNTETTSPVAAAALSALAETKAAVAAAFNKKRGSTFGDSVTGMSVNPQRRGRGRPPGSGMKKRKRKTSSASLSSLSRSVSDGENYKMRNSLSIASKKKNRSASTTTSSESGSNDEKVSALSYVKLEIFRHYSPNLRVKGTHFSYLN